MCGYNQTTAFISGCAVNKAKDQIIVNVIAISSIEVYFTSEHYYVVNVQTCKRDQCHMPYRIPTGLDEVQVYCVSPGQAWSHSARDQLLLESHGYKGMSIYTQHMDLLERTPQRLGVCRKDIVCSVLHESTAQLHVLYFGLSYYYRNGQADHQIHHRWKIVLSTRTTRSGKPLVCSPIRISSCPASKNIAVVDADLGNHGRQSKPLVLVMNEYKDELFTFRGDDVPKSMQTGKSIFDPSDVRFDSAGNIVVADWNSCCIHLINGNGTYNRLLYTDNASAVALGLAHGNIVWAVFGDTDYKVKLLKYSSV